MTLDYNKQRKLQLIEDILKIIFKQVELVKIEEREQVVTFVKQYPGQPQIFRLMRMTWDNNLDFVIYEYLMKDWQGVFVPTSRWFQVRDLIRKRFLDAEKLKKE
jgi:hypothetical protein